jgi:hypothetical protein
MFGTSESMTFVRVGDVVVCLAGFLQGCYKLYRFLRWNLRIFFAVHDQQRRLDPFDIRQHIRFPINRRLFLGSSTHLGLPANLRIAIGVLQKQCAIHHSKHLDARSKGIRELRHGIRNNSTSMAAAADADTRRVSESLCDQVMHSRGDIIDFSAPGVLDVQIAKPFSVACAATKIRLEYHKTLPEQETETKEKGSTSPGPQGLRAPRSP